MNVLEVYTQWGSRESYEPPVARSLAELEADRLALLRAVKYLCDSPRIKQILDRTQESLADQEHRLREVDLAILRCKIVHLEANQGASTDLSACGHAQADTAGQATKQAPTAAA